MQLSPSKLSVLRDCPRCFYLENKHNIKRPRGIFPSLPGGIDLVLKDYFDSYRSLNRTPDCIADLEGQSLFKDSAKLNLWRNWRTGLSCFVEGVKLIGALDDALINEVGEVSPLDNKTKGSMPKDDGSQYYQTQLDCYDLMLKENGYKTSGLAYLAYFWPQEVGEYSNGQIFKFGVKVFQIKCSAESAVNIVKQAKKILEEQELMNTHKNKTNSFFISGDSDLFAKIAEKLLGYYPGDFHRVTL